MYAYQIVDKFKEQLLNNSDICHKRDKGIPAASLNTLSIKSYILYLFGTDDEKK